MLYLLFCTPLGGALLWPGLALLAVLALVGLCKIAGAPVATPPPPSLQPRPLPPNDLRHTLTRR